MPRNSQTSNISPTINMLDLNRIFQPRDNNPEEYLQRGRVRIAGDRPRRPQNAFFIFRQNVSKEARRVGVKNMRLISTVSGHLWRNSSEEQKAVYEAIAVQVRALHREAFPDFIYTRPRSRFEFREYEPKAAAQNENNSQSETRDASTHPEISAISFNESAVIAPTVPSNFEDDRENSTQDNL
ncbi:5513_t:CDS:1 [Ambispora gerdemannii]|uniref:5513_t:CDS:1 n=1 Tax=Ambispora gerdemannii TaxID=144530 RepID=A0A9N8W4E8_9GLOM|nr:5513_t:CDS:1 [Ambispora gerdemannii]